jgi:hypothetical protein
VAVSRTVTLILVDDAGEVLGALPPLDVELPWWQSAADVVDAVRHRFNLDVTILRLLHAERPAPPGGAVTYLAQVSSAPEVALVPVRIRLSDDPRRAAYARPGGPQASLDWARSALPDPVVAVAQQRTWNLSSIWRLDTTTGPVWLKEVPPFFAHEPAVLGWLAQHGHAELVPRLLAHDGGRMLLAHIAGEDLYGAPLPIRDAIAERMHRIQVQSLVEVDRLLRLGVPDRRPSALNPLITRVAEGSGVEGLDDQLADLPSLLTAIQECGLPDTLVHGDLHPGNVRGSLVLIDWGDSVVSHPAFDILRLTDDLPPDDAAALCEAWAQRWRAAVPGCDPLRALELIRPVAALVAAAAYAGFLDNIEPAEHPYHRDDVPAYLRRAAALLPPVQRSLPPAQRSLPRAQQS